MMRNYFVLISTVLPIVLGSSVDEGHIDDAEFELLEVSSLIESAPDTNSEANGTITSSEASSAETQTPINWCAWFEVTEFRIESYTVLANSQEIRLKLYDIPIEVVERFMSEKTGRAVSKEFLIAASENLVDDEWSQGVLNRLVSGTRPWLKSSNPQRGKLETLLYSGLESLLNKTDMNRLSGILGQYIVLLERGRSDAQQTKVNDEADRLKLIEEVKANAGNIRACFEHHLKLVTEERMRIANKLLYMETIINRNKAVRDVILKRLQTASGTSSTDLTLERSIKSQCFESVKRIVFSNKRGIATEVQAELTILAHNHNMRILAPILPIYLRAVDDLRAQLAAKQEKLTPSLTSKRDASDRFLGETRVVLSQLERYITQ